MTRESITDKTPDTRKDRNVVPENVINEIKTLMLKVTDRSNKLDRKTFNSFKSEILNKVEQIRNVKENPEVTNFLQDFEISFLPILEDPISYEVQEEETAECIMADFYIEMINSLKVIREVEGNLSDRSIFEEIHKITKDELDSLDLRTNLMGLEKELKDKYVAALRTLKKYEAVISIIINTD